MSLRKLSVIYNGWGEHWPVGQLADDGETLLFEYSAAAMERGLQLSPLRLPLGTQAFGDYPLYLQRLPGFISDSLPDGWGLLVMNRLFRANGLDPATMSPLDRLAFVGDRGLGALSFEPPEKLDLKSHETTLLKLAQQTRAVIAGEDGDALKQLALLGGSPHGARPKVLIYYNPNARTVSGKETAGHEPWLVKFQAQTEHKEVCAIEHLYAELAKQAGMDMTETRYFELDAKLNAFGTRRFDVQGQLRVPIVSLAGALHVDFRVPSAVDYTTFLRVIRAYSHDEREVVRGFERAVFNVIFHNRDDHPKNFSLRLSREGQWKLSPAYDLTYCEGPGGQHHMDVCGEGRAVTREKLLELAQRGGVQKDVARSTIERMTELAASFRSQASAYAIRRKTVNELAAAIEANRARMGGGAAGTHRPTPSSPRTARSAG